MARDGVDADFGRGSDAFDNYFGDPKVTPNPNLGPIAVAPYYAVPIVPGDLGTKGGLVTDEHARVLKPDGSVIRGLYATGNTSASVMGRSYAGAGATLGPALTFGYIAVNHMAAGSTNAAQKE
jgi:3-oxosteroid 1-dehydrogenase